MKRSLLVLLFASIVPASAQTASPEVWARVGLFGGMNINIHSAGYEELSGVPNCCPEFESGSGIGGAIGLMYEHMLGGPLELALRAGFQGRGATLEAREPIPLIIDGELYDGEIRHVLEAGLGHLTIEPMLGVRVGRIVGFHLGPSVGFPVSTTFAQREELAKPEDIGTFENDSRVRNDTSGTIPNAASFDAGITFGVSADIAVNEEKTVIVSPELFFTADLTNVTTDLSWKSHALRIGVAIKYALEREPSPVGIAPVIDDVAPVSSSTPITITALAVRANGVESSDATMHIEEFISTNMRPLLNYVFFDEGSSQLSERYTRVDAVAFDAERLHSLDAIDTYHHVLNIVGERLREHPRAVVTLVGCNTASGAETGARGLSRARAAAVREYLRTVWSIDTARVRVEARDLPALPSDTATADGRAENRRVEIIVDERAVLAPVVTADTLRTVTPPVVRFRPGVAADAGVARWQLAATQRGAVVKSLEGEGVPPTSIDWETNEDQLRIPNADDSLRYQLRVEDRVGKVSLAGGALPVNLITLRRKREERIGDRVIDRYSLILFEYDRSDLDAINADIAADIRSRITSDATVTVTGHTDRIGDETYNQRLSEDRARNVARALGIAPERASGLGERRLLYDNELPEGRFYSRTVSIVVETPTK
jgi:outer membrane protein OmpA-like peptidoglycan-associated protein